jgi:hypothetical protein
MRFLTSTRPSAWLLLALLAGAPACVVSATTGDVSATKLAQGDQLVTNDPTFDEFFASTSNVLSRTSSLASPALHKPIARMLDTKAADDERATLDAVKARADKLKAAGSSVYPVLHPDAKLVVQLEGADKDAAALMTGLESAMREGLSRARQFEALSREIEALEARRETLEGTTGSTFADADTKSEVERELQAARGLLAEARLRADAETGRALRFVVALAAAIDTGSAAKLASSETPTPALGAKPARGGKPGAKPGGGAKPTGGGAKPGGAAKPAKPKKPAEDFDP